MFFGFCLFPTKHVNMKISYYFQVLLLIDCCLMSPEQYFNYIHEENMSTNEKKEHLISIATGHQRPLPTWGSLQAVLFVHRS